MPHQPARGLVRLTLNRPRTRALWRWSISCAGLRCGVNRPLRDEVTQQNSALVEENAATAKTLEYQARAMDEQVAHFQISDNAQNENDAPAPVAREQRAMPAPPSRGPAAKLYRRSAA